MNMKEKTLSSAIKFEGKIINLKVDEIELPDGRKSVREVVEHPGGVCVAAVDENDCLFLVKQFRYPFKEETIELPAGKRDKQNEEPLETGKRELFEETGTVAETYKCLGRFYSSPGCINEIVYMFAAKDLKEGEQHLDDGEFAEVMKVPFEKAVRMIMNDEIRDGKSVTAILKLKELRDKGEF